MEWQGRQGRAGRGSDWRDAAGRGRRDTAGQGTVSNVMAWPGRAWRREAGVVWFGNGKSRGVVERFGRRGMVRHGMEG